MNEGSLPSSFRDSAGYVFKYGDLIHRKITNKGIEDFRKLMSGNLYETATEQGLLLKHKEVSLDGESTLDSAVLLPEQLPFVSYPYEWCFSQLKASALLVLDLQELALSHGMTLKDASAYNVQMLRGRPIFIDTSSFEAYHEGSVWNAYRQFCEHFLAPLLLMSRVDDRLSRLLGSFIDGVPVDLAAKLVPKKTWLNPWLYMHVGLHGKAQKSGEKSGAKEGTMPKSALLGLLKSLRQAVEALQPIKRSTQWGDYSSASSYEGDAAQHKHSLVQQYSDGLTESPGVVWDLGANAGEFSRIFSSKGQLTIAWDGDPSAVEQNYTAMASKKEESLIPLVQDFSAPSPSLGWMAQERMSFFDRGPADLSLALALIHHIVIGNSVPLRKVADFFARTAWNLIIEFVGPEDARVKQLLSTRSDTHEYTQGAFEAAFSQEFDILRKDPIRNSERTLYLMKRIGH